MEYVASNIDQSMPNFDIEKIITSMVFYGYAKSDLFESAMFSNKRYANFFMFLEKSGEQKSPKDYVYVDASFLKVVLSPNQINDLFTIFSVEELLASFYKRAGANLFTKIVLNDSKHKSAPVEDVKKAMNIVKEKLVQIEQKLQNKQKSKSLEEIYKEYILNVLSNKKENGIIGISSGITVLDKITKGFKPSEYIIVAGRPSMGKTSLSLDIVVSALKNGHSVLFLSLEMPAEQLVARLIPKIDPSVPLSTSIGGDNFEALGDRVFSALSFFQHSKLTIDDFQGKRFTLENIESSIEQYYEDNKKYPDMIVIDYIQRIHSKSDQNEGLTEISLKIAEMAKATKAAVVALSQLNRSLESRSDRRPMNSDLRGSGSLEQDADIILFPYRPLVYKERELMEILEKKPDNEGVANALESIRLIQYEQAEIIVSKNRNGPIGSAPIIFDRKRASFMNANIPAGVNSVGIVQE